MITSWFTLEKLSIYLKQKLVGTTIRSACTIHKNELILLNETNPAESLIINLGSAAQSVLIQDVKPPKKAVSIFANLNTAKILDVLMHPSDRIIFINLEQDCQLAIAIRTPRGNVYYRDGSEWTSFKKESFSFSLPREDALVSPSSLESDPRFNRYWRMHTAALLATQEYVTILNEFQRANGQVISGRFVLLPKSDESFNAEIFYHQYSTFIKNGFRERDFDDIKQQLIRTLQHRQEQMQRKIRQLETTEATEVRAAQYRYWADMLSSFQYQIVAGEKVFIIPKEYHDERFPAMIILNPAEAIHRNIEKYYHKAHQLNERKQSHLQLHQDSQKDLSAINILLTEVQTFTDLPALKRWQQQHQSYFTQQITKERSDGTSLPYWTEFYKNWEIWIGKSAADNDDMTLHYAAKSDLWLHVRHSTGSHVIIRSQGKKDYPPEVIRYAASLAARYSKEKHSSLVTVVATQKKYVIKRKGFPPGKVSFQYEKDILIEPKPIDIL